MAYETLTLGELIRRKRRERGLLQKFVAQRSGLTNSQLSRFENDKAEPSVKSLVLIGWALGIPLDDLFRLSAHLEGYGPEEVEA
ncbi:MAG: helix-turn-helix transcriptional regulator [Dehalococcoidia bacterium]